MHSFFSLLAIAGRTLFCLVFSSLSLAQSIPSPEVTRGLVWLTNQVSVSGQITNEAQSIATPFQARVETGLALNLLSKLPPALATSIGAEPDDPTEYLARKAIILNMGGIDTSSILATLLARQNADGGFGAGISFTSGGYDTAWSILALTQLGQGPGLNATQARAYLRSLQATDGGMAPGSDTQRAIETAFATFAFRTGTDPASQAAAQSAIAYLKSLQLSDASWVSSLYVTATVWTAISSNVSVQSDRDRVTTFLKTAQQADGSWADDPFLTAIILRALSAGGQSSVAGSVAGRIVEQSSNTPLAGATLHIALSGASPQSVVTGSDGTFNVSNLAAGSYVVAIAKAGYQSSSLNITVAANQPLILGDVPLQISTNVGVLRGQISAAATNSTLAGVVVSLAGTPALTATTGNDGRYEIVNVPVGIAQITAAKPGFLTSAGTTPILSGLAVVFSPALYASGSTPPTQSILVGKVIAAGTNVALANVSIALNGTTVGVTAADGTFNVSVTPASYSVSYTLAGYRTVSSNIVVPSGTSMDAGITVLFVPLSASKISGTVAQFGGGALAGASVSLQGGATIITGSDGHFSFDNLTGFSFSVSASAPGFIAQSVSRQVAEPTAIAQDFILVSQAQSLVQMAPLLVSPASSGANTNVLATTTVTNPGATTAQLRFDFQIFNSQNKLIGQGIVINAQGQPLGVVQVAAGALLNIQANWNSGQFGPDTYQLRLRALAIIDPNSQATDAVVLGVGSGSLSITPDLSIFGSVTANPPALHAGSVFPVKLSSVMSNTGNSVIAAGNYRLRIFNTQTNVEAYNQQVVGTALPPSQIANLVFPEWMPLNPGSYQAEVTSVAGVAGRMTTTIFVGDNPVASYAVDKAVVPTGNQAVKATVNLRGIDPISGVITDPLTPLLKRAIALAVKFSDDKSTAITVGNRCVECHVQSQAIVAGEVNRDIALFDDQQRAINFNAMVMFPKPDGHVGGWNPYPGQPIDNLLGLWSLTFHHAKERIATVLRNAADFALTQQDSSTGKWPSIIPLDSYRSGWWASDLTFSGLNLRSLIEVSGSLDAMPDSVTRSYSLKPYRLDTQWPGSGSIGHDKVGNLYYSSTNGLIQQIKPDGTDGTRWIGNGWIQAIIEPPDGLGMVASFPDGIHRLFPDGTYSAVPLVPIQGPLELMYGPDGVLWASSYIQNKIWRIAPDWSSTVWLADGPLVNPLRVFLMPNGDFLVANYGDATLIVIKPDRSSKTVMPFLNGNPIDIARAPDGGLFLTTLNGLFRLYDDYSIVPVVVDRIVDEIYTQTNGRVFAVSHIPVNGIFELVSAPIDKPAVLGRYAASIGKGADWLVAQNDSNNIIPLPMAHQLIGLAAAKKFYAGQPRADQIASKMAAIGTELLRRQNTDGGWGYKWYGPSNATNLGSDSLVTAQVSYALDSLGLSAASSGVRKTMNLLLSRQQPDGSWISENGVMQTSFAATSWVAIWLRKMVDRTGIIDGNLTLAFPPTVQMANAIPAASTIQTLPSGETIYNWALTGLTASGTTINFDLGLQDMQPGEKRAVSTEAYLSFINTFSGDIQTAPIASPVIQADDGIDLLVTPDRLSYPAFSTAQIPTTLTNRNPSVASGTLSVTIADNNDAVVSQVVTPIPSVPANSVLIIPGVFNVGTTQVGQYKVKAILTDDLKRVLAQGLTQFDILPDLTPLAARVATNKGVYESRDVVAINGGVYNRAANVILSNYAVQETVLDPNGLTVFTATRAISQIVANGQIELPFSFRLPNAAPGIYTVSQTVLDALGVIQNTQSATFKVQASNTTGSSLRGLIVSTPKQLQRGSMVSFAYSLNNLGNSDYTGLPVKVTVLDPVNQVVVPVSNTAITLPQLGTVQASATWNSGSILAPAASTTGLSTYIVALSATIGGVDKALSQDVLVVGDLQPFVFSPQLGVALNQALTSNAITLKGIALDAPISVVGGQYSVNGAAFTSSAGVVHNGDLITVQQLASSTPGVKSSAILTVLGQSASFDVTTFLPIITPDPFVFNTQTSVTRATVQTSNTVTITGVNTATPVSIVGGEYSLNGAPFISAPGTLVSGTTLVVRQSSSALFGTSSTLVMTVGTVSVNFMVTTVAARVIPNAFNFASQSGVAFSAQATSNIITVSGIDIPVAISVIGGMYSVNGGAYTNAAGLVSAGDMVSVRLTASPLPSTAVTATLSVNTVSAGFTATTVAAITTPGPFGFAPQVGVPVSALRLSNAVLITAINVATPISVTNGEYAINGGSFTNLPGTVKVGDSIVVRQTASAAYGTKTTVLLTVGTVTSGFDITTLVAVLTPNPFSFAAQTAVALKTSRLSNAITVSGINVPVPIQITGGEYSLNGGAFVSVAGTVNANDSVVVRQTSSAQFSTKTTATLTISTVSANFDITTLAAITTPDPFSFVPQDAVALGAVLTSNTVTITGINTTVPVSITGGMYSLNGSTFTNVAGTLKAGDTLAVRLTASASYATTSTALLTISQSSSAFVTTTVAAPKVAVAAAVARESRVLILLSCKQSEGEGNDDDVSCLSQRQAFVNTYLTGLGWDAKIVTDTVSFQSELRCGRYNTYWLAGGYSTLPSALLAELREAVFRGGALIVDGVPDKHHDEDDSSHSDFSSLTGVAYKGKSDEPNSVVLASSFLPAGSFAYAGEASRVDLTTGVKLAAFGSANGDAAIVTNSVGGGKALYFAFDLVGTLQSQASSALLKNTLNAGLDYVTPVLPDTVIGDAYVPFAITLKNTAVTNQTIDVLVTLPAGVTYADSVPQPTTLAGNVLTWHVTVLAGQSYPIDFGIRAPTTSGRYIVKIDANAIDPVTGIGASIYTNATAPIVLVVAGMDQSASSTVAALQATVFSSNQDRKSRDNAVSALQNAISKTNNGQFDTALKSYIQAVHYLSKITGSGTLLDVASRRTAIDWLIAETSRKACRGNAVCAVSNLVPTGYNVTVFGSANMANGQSSGSVGVGGAVTMNTFAVGTNLYGDNARLIVGGSLAFNSGSVGQDGSGVIRVAGSASVAQSVSRHELTTGFITDDWVSVKAKYLAASDNLASLLGTPAVGNGGSNSNQFSCNGSNATLNVCTLSSAQFTQARSLNLNYPSTASVVINVTGGTVALSNGQVTFNGDTLANSTAAKRVIFKSAQAGSVSINGFGMGGALLAPRASLSHNNGTIDGPVIVNSLSSTGSFTCNSNHHGGDDD